MRSNRILLCVLVMGVLFFFCKQKTAYEMRISDWSSDVCSSDLVVAEGVLATVTGGVHEPDPAVRCTPAACRPAQQVVQHGDHRGDADAGGEQEHRAEIGRASCRERVCQYV